MQRARGENKGKEEWSSSYQKVERSDPKTEKLVSKGKQNPGWYLLHVYRPCGVKNSEVVFSGWEVEKINSEVVRTSTSFNRQDLPRGDA